MAALNAKMQALADAAKKKLGQNTSTLKQGTNQGKFGVIDALTSAPKNDKGTPDIRP